MIPKNSLVSYRSLLPLNMEGFLLTPPDKGTIIGRAVWKVCLFDSLYLRTSSTGSNRTPVLVEIRYCWATPTRPYKFTQFSVSCTCWSIQCSSHRLSQKPLENKPRTHLSLNIQIQGLSCYFQTQVSLQPLLMTSCAYRMTKNQHSNSQ